MYVKVKLLSRARLFATPWTVACTKLLHPWDFLGKSTGVSWVYLHTNQPPVASGKPRWVLCSLGPLWDLHTFKMVSHTPSLYYSNKDLQHSHKCQAHSCVPESQKPSSKVPLALVKTAYPSRATSPEHMVEMSWTQSPWGPLEDASPRPHEVLMLHFLLYHEWASLPH